MANNFLDAIGYFETSPTLAVAVSGGADSMALLLLAAEWAKKKNGKVIALTVDHGLRKESAAEAAQVGAWCKALGIEHHILTWKKTAKKIMQAEARDARYQLLTDWCHAYDVLHLLTAHHRDDQAETFFFRLSRGSGMEGLAAIPAISYRQGIRLIRPLLGFSKAQLEDLLKEKKQSWVLDPSNKNPKYTRNRIRGYLAASADPEDISQRAAELAERFGHIRLAMEQALAKRLPQVVSFSPDGGFLHLESFLQLPEIYGRKTLALIAQRLGNKPYPPRSEKLDRLYEDILHGRIHKRRSFGGLLFTAKKAGFLIRVEPKTLEKSAAAPHMSHGKALG